MLEIRKNVTRWKTFKCKRKCVTEFPLAFLSYSDSNVNVAHGLEVQIYGTTAHASSSLSSPKVQ